MKREIHIPPVTHVPMYLLLTIANARRVSYSINLFTSTDGASTRVLRLVFSSNSDLDKDPDPGLLVSSFFRTNYTRGPRFPNRKQLRSYPVFDQNPDGCHYLINGHSDGGIGLFAFFVIEPSTRLLHIATGPPTRPLKPTHAPLCSDLSVSPRPDLEQRFAALRLFTNLSRPSRFQPLLV